MALIKTIASVRQPDGTWSPQQDIEMHPLEEAAILADWAAGEHKMSKPSEMTDKEKIEALSDTKKGAEFIAQKTEQESVQMDDWKQQYDSLVSDREAKYQAYHESLNK